MNMAIVVAGDRSGDPGRDGDRIGIHHAFFLPVICYLYILFYALRGSMPNSERYANGLRTPAEDTQCCLPVILAVPNRFGSLLE
jgi:hypothetical protein